jgi:hypothetical protein
VSEVLLPGGSLDIEAITSGKHRDQSSRQTYDWPYDEPWRHKIESRSPPSRPRSHR